MSDGFGTVNVEGPTAGACCDCAKQVDCNCTSAPCGLTCEFKSATAALCGKPGYTPNSTKFYKHEEISGTMSQKIYPENTCAESSCAQPEANVNQSGNNGVQAWDYSVTKIGFNAVTGLFKYQVACTDGNIGDSGHGGYVQISFNALIATYPSGAVVEIPACTAFFTLALFWSNLAPISGSGGSGYTPPHAVEKDIEDNWDVTTTFQGKVDDLNNPICVGPDQTDGNTRTVDGVDDSANFPPTTPNEAYPGRSAVTVTENTRTTQGAGTCLADPDTPGKFRKTDGTVTETLSSEDTESSAIQRVSSKLVWKAALTCADASTFRTVRAPGQSVMAFRSARVRANVVAALPNTDYNVRIYLTSRILGTGGKFLPLRNADQSVHTDADGKATTTWLDIDEQAGLEIRAESCAVLPS